MTFKELIDDAADRLQNTQPEARVRFRRYLNEWHRRIMTKVTSPRGGTSTIAVVAGTAEYDLDDTVSRIRTIRSTVNRRVLREMPQEWMRQEDPDESNTGTPDYFAYVTPTRIRLHPIPSANETLELDVDNKVDEMDADAQVPIMPESFHFLLSLGIRINEYEKNSDTRLRDARIDMERGIADLRHYLASRRTNVPNPGRWNPGHSSRLGGWYPRNT